MKTTITVKATFTGAHRIAGSGIPCEALHGHSFDVYFTLASQKMESGMIIEFEDAERRVQKWINENWDHNVILSDSDAQLGAAISGITKQSIFYYQGIPTTENLAAYLLNDICPKLFADTNAMCVKVHLEEYSKSKYSATVEL